MVWKRSLAVVAMGLLVVGLAVSRGRAEDEQQAQMQAKIGEAAPPFSLQDQNGKQVSLSDCAGKVVVLEWFNEECPFVVKYYQSNAMNDLAKRYTAKDVAWLAINSTHGKTNDDNQRIAEKWHIDRPILNDSDGVVGKEYGSKNTPTMYIIDKEGKLVYSGAIDDQPSPDPETLKTATNYVSKALDEVLNGHTVSTPKTRPYGCSVKYAR